MSDVKKTDFSDFTGSQIDPSLSTNEATSVKTSKVSENEEETKIIQESEEFMLLYNRTLEAAAKQDPKTINHLMLAIRSLMKIQETIQRFGTTISDMLNISSDKLAVYAKMTSQIPVVTKDSPFKFEGEESEQNQARSLLNQEFGMMLEAVRANKGVEEDKAKKVQALLSSIKDASSEKQNMITNFIDTLKSISQRITANL